MLYGGDLYKGFLDFGQIFTYQSGRPVREPSLDVANLRCDCYLAILAMLTVMCRLADHLIELDQQTPSFRLMLYIGELLDKDQKVLLSRAFPSAQIGPIQYGSVDEGLIGLPDFLPVALIGIPHLTR